jgi:putative transposase
MKRKRFSEEQIIAILREHEAGVATADLCRKHGMSSASRCSAQGLVLVYSASRISSWRVSSLASLRPKTFFERSLTYISAGISELRNNRCAIGLSAPNRSPFRGDFPQCSSDGLHTASLCQRPRHTNRLKRPFQRMPSANLLCGNGGSDDGPPRTRLEHRSVTAQIENPSSAAWRTL